MSATLTARLRRLWLDLHLWVGAGLFVLLVPLGLSGSILVYREPLDRVLHAERHAVSNGPATLEPSAYLDAAAQAFGDRVRPAQLRLPAQLGEPVIVSGRGRASKPGARPAMLNAWLDPQTGRVLDTGPGMDGAMRLAHDIHGQMLIPEVGRQVVGWLGLAMLANCLTGLWLWWPRGGDLRKGLRWRRSPSTVMNLHHLVGVSVLVPLAALSLTGAWISFPEAARALSGQARPNAISGGRPRFAAPIAHPRLTPDEAAALALVARPGARLVSLSLPAKGRQPAWRIEISAPGAGRPQALQVEDATGAVSPAPLQGQGGDPLGRAMRQLHEGGMLGPVWRAAVFVAGLAPALLGVTGIIMWLRRRARRRVLHALQPSAG